MRPALTPLAAAGVVAGVVGAYSSHWVQKLHRRVREGPIGRLSGSYGNVPISPWLRGRLAILTLGLLMVIAGALLLYVGGGLTFVKDEWAFIYTRRQWTLDVFLAPHNGNLVLFPVGVFKVLFATVGLTEHWVYRLTVVGAHLVCVALVFVLARRRVGDGLALAACVPILLLGSAYENLLWPFQVGLIASVAAGLGTLLMLDRRDTRGDISACLLLTLSVASGSVGVAVAVAVLVEVLLGADRLRRLWIAALPLGLYALWYVTHGPSGLPRGGTLGANLSTVPSFVADVAAAAFAGLAGLAPYDGGPLAVGAILVAVIVVARRGLRTAVSVRFLSLLAAALALWTLTGLARAHFGVASAYQSRYVYFGAVLIVLLAVELARGTRPTRPALAVVTLLVAAAAVGNMQLLREGVEDFRAESDSTVGSVAALELGPATVPGARVQVDDPRRCARAPRALESRCVDPKRWWLIAEEYFRAAAELGSPAYPAQLAAMPKSVGRSPRARRRLRAHRAADTGLARVLGVKPEPARDGLALGAGPVVEGANGGTAADRGSCVEFRPRVANASLDLAVPEAGIRVRGRQRDPVSVVLRRLADRFPRRPFTSLGGRSDSVLLLPRGKLPTPWHVRLATAAPIEVCGVARPSTADLPAGRGE